MICNLLSLDTLQSLPCQFQLSHTGFLPGPEKAKQSQGSCICSSLYLEKHSPPTARDHLPQFSHISSQICLYVNFSNHPLLNNSPSKSFPFTLTGFVFLHEIYHTIYPLWKLHLTFILTAYQFIVNQPLFKDCAFQKTSKFSLPITL